MNTFGVDKVNGQSPFSVSIVGPHALVELVKENFKRPTSDRRDVVLGRLTRTTRRWRR